MPEVSLGAAMAGMAAAAEAEAGAMVGSMGEGVMVEAVARTVGGGRAEVVPTVEVAMEVEGGWAICPKGAPSRADGGRSQMRQVRPTQSRRRKEPLPHTGRTQRHPRPTASATWTDQHPAPHTRLHPHLHQRSRQQMMARSTHSLPGPARECP